MAGSINLCEINYSGKNYSVSPKLYFCTNHLKYYALKQKDNYVYFCAWASISTVYISGNLRQISIF